VLLDLRYGDIEFSPHIFNAVEYPLLA